MSILVPIKGGDKITAPGKEYMGCKHGDILGHFDLNHPLYKGKSLDEILPWDARRIFQWITVDGNKEDLIKDATQPLGVNDIITESEQYSFIKKAALSTATSNTEIPDKREFRPHKYRLSFDKLAEHSGIIDINGRVLSKTEATPVIDCSTLPLDAFLDASTLSNERTTPDNNAISIGYADVGVGGTYLAWYLWSNDLANLTGPMRIRQISDTTETSAITVTETMGYPLILCMDLNPHNGDRNSGWRILSNVGATQTFNLQQEGNGLVIDGLHIDENIHTATWSSIFIGVHSVVTETILKNIIIDGNNNGLSSIFVNDTDAILTASNVIASDSLHGAKTNACNIATTINKCHFHNNTTGLDANNYAITVRDTVCSSNTTNFANIGNATGEGNAAPDTSVDDANWGSGSGNKPSFVFGTEFETDVEDTVQDGLLLRLKLNNNADDATGNYSPTGYNMTYGDGILGGTNNAGVYNGTTSRIFIGAGVVNGLTHASFTGWFRPTLVNKCLFGAYGYAGFFIYITSSQYIGIKFATVGVTYTEKLINLDIWQHISVVKDGTNCLLYINGIHIATKTVDATIYDFPNSLEVGRYNGATLLYSGSMDEVLIHNRAITPDEIKELANYSRFLKPLPTGTLADAGVSVTVDKDDVPSGLEHRYLLNNNTEDSVGNQDGVNYNVTPTINYLGEENSAMYFNGTSGYVDLVNMPTINNVSAFTIAAWVRTSDTQGSIFYANKTDALHEITLTIGGLAANSLDFRVEDGSNSYIYAPYSAYYGYWTHVVGVYDGSAAPADRLKIYLNGVLQSVTAIGTAPTTSPDLSGGNAWIMHTSFYLQSSISDMQFYNRALNPSEILALAFNPGSSVTSGIGNNPVPHGPNTTIGAKEVPLLGQYVSKWNSSNNVFALLAGAMKNGYNPDSFNTGLLPTYQGESADFDKAIYFDGSTSYLQTNYSVPLTNSSELVIEIAYNETALGKYLTGQFDNASNRWYVYIYSTGEIEFRFVVGGASRTIKSSTQITSGTRFIHCIKSGATCSIRIDNVEVSYSAKVDYDIGSYTPTNKVVIGQLNSSAYFKGQIYAVTFYDADISNTRRAANVAAGKTLGVVASKQEDDTMHFDIGTWDNTNCVFALAAASYNRELYQDTGDFPLYQGPSAGSTITATLTNFTFPYGYMAHIDCQLKNMTSGYGYDKASGSIRFDGINDYIQTNYKLSVSNSSTFTFVAYLLFDLTAASWKTIAAIYDDSNNYMYIDTNTTHYVQAGFKISGVSTIVTASSEQLVAGNIYQVVLIKNGSTLELRVNAVEPTYSTQNTYASGDKSFNTSLVIGQFNSADYWNSDIYRVQLYDRVLTDQELLEDYQAKSPFFNLRLYEYNGDGRGIIQ